MVLARVTTKPSPALSSLTRIAVTVDKDRHYEAIKASQGCCVKSETELLCKNGMLSLVTVGELVAVYSTCLSPDRCANCAREGR